MRSPAVLDAPTIDASVNYHVKKSEPQNFEFDVDGIVGNLVSPELVKTPVKVSDVRSSAFQPEFARDGLAFLDDWMDIGLVYPDRLGQILGVAANDDHEWFYQSAMTPDEIAVFNIYDNQGRPQLAHSALDPPGDADASHPRKSIESRTLVRYS